MRSGGRLFLTNSAQGSAIACRGILWSFVACGAIASMTAAPAPAAGQTAQRRPAPRYQTSVSALAQRGQMMRMSAMGAHTYVGRLTPRYLPQSVGGFYPALNRFPPGQAHQGINIASGGRQTGPLYIPRRTRR
jgi:hypothetical protein